MQAGTQVTSKPSDRGEQGEAARQMLNAGCFAVRVLCTCGGRTAAAAVLSSLRGGKVSSPFALAAMEADSEEKRALDSFACVQRAHSLPSLTGVYSAAQFVHTFGTMGSAKQKAGCRHKASIWDFVRRLSVLAEGRRILLKSPSHTAKVVAGKRRCCGGAQRSREVEEG